VKKREAALLKDPAFKKALAKMEKAFKASGGKISDTDSVLKANYASPGWMSKATAGHAGGNINAPMSSPSVRLHELGHSTVQSAKTKTRLAKVLNKFRRVNTNIGYPLSKVLGIGGGTAYAALSKDPDKAAKRGAIAGAVGSAPMIGEEVAANVQAGKQLYRSAGGGKAGRKAVMKFLHNIKGAQGTYVALAASAVLAPYAIGKFREANKEASVNMDLSKLAAGAKKKSLPHTSKGYSISRYMTSPEAATIGGLKGGPLGIAKAFGISSLGREMYLRGALHRAKKGKKAFGSNDAKLLASLRKTKSGKETKGGAFSAAWTNPSVKSGVGAASLGGAAAALLGKPATTVKALQVEKLMKQMPGMDVEDVSGGVKQFVRGITKLPTKQKAAIIAAAASMGALTGWGGAKLNAFMQSRAARGRANIERSGHKLIGLKPSKANRRIMDSLKKTKTD
jgi:hypothetical protein